MFYSKKFIKNKCLQHPRFPGRLRSNYWSGPTLLNLPDLTGWRVLNVLSKLFMTSNSILELIKRVLIQKCRCIYKRCKIRLLFGIRRPRSGMCVYGLVAAQPPHHHGLVGRTLKRGTFLPGYRTIHGEDADSSWIRVYCATFFSWIFMDFLIQNNNRGLPNLS